MCIRDSNKTEMLTAIEYSNDAIADAWDMEMLSEIAPVKKIMDTAKKIDSLPKATPPTKPIPSSKINKDSALDPLNKKKKATAKKNVKL